MTRVLFDFSDPATAGKWAAIDDRVMGGVSQSHVRAIPEGHAVFEGEVSLERNGGFASVRSHPGPLGTAGATTCLIEARGDGKRYKLSILTDDDYDSVNYQAGFTPATEGWQTLRLPLADFRPSFRGRAVHGAPPLDAARIRQVGLLIADRQVGTFSLQVRRISLA
jgi:hypothetical protein